jgi:hypothetical protein
VALPLEATRQRVEKPIDMEKKNTESENESQLKYFFRLKKKADQLYL